jgi:hypothetical protein
VRNLVVLTSSALALVVGPVLFACGSDGDGAGSDLAEAGGDGSPGGPGSIEGGVVDATDGAKADASDASTDAPIDADAADGDGAPVVAPFCKLGNASCLARLDIGGKTLPYYRSHPLETPNGALQNLVLVMHGNDRDADAYFATVADVAKARDPVHTLVVAPWLQAVPTSATPCAGNPNAPLATDLYWSCGGWLNGNKATNSTTTSFEAIDALVSAAKTAFPSIVRVTIVGYSAGAQTINRYIAGSTEEEKTPLVETRYVVSSASSYLYFDNRRLKADAVCPDEAGCLVDATSFDGPYFDAANCPTYDDYKFGVADDVMGVTTITGYLKNIPPATLQSRYVSRKVVYIYSTNDASDVGAVDTGCEANAQGPLGTSFRLQRGLTYHRYVTMLLGATHRVAVVPVCGHDHDCVLRTSVAQDEMFGP